MLASQGFAACPKLWLYTTEKILCGGVLTAEFRRRILELEITGLRHSHSRTSGSCPPDNRVRHSALAGFAGPEKRSAGYLQYPVGGLSRDACREASNGHRLCPPGPGRVGDPGRSLDLPDQVGAKSRWRYLP